MIKQLLKYLKVIDYTLRKYMGGQNDHSIGFLGGQAYDIGGQ